MRSAACSLALILLAACARSEDASTLPSDTNGLAPTAAEEAGAAESDDDRLAIGEWRESLQDEAQALEFGSAGAPPVFSMRCDARRGVVLQRHGIPPAGDLQMMIVSIGNDARRLPVTSGSGPIPMLRAVLNARDPLLSTLAQEGSPITIRVGDTLPLVLPPSPTIGEFVSLCASGGGQSTGEETNASAGTENSSEPADTPVASDNQAAPAQ